METTYTAQPTLSFGQAMSQALGRLCTLKGRSRRSEFWWFMLIFVILYCIISSFISIFVELLAAQIIEQALCLVAVPITVRRLHDCGHSGWWCILSWLSSTAISILFITSGAADDLMSINGDFIAAMERMNTLPVKIISAISVVTSIATFIFCFIDSQKKANRYGNSPKYVPNSTIEEP